MRAVPITVTALAATLLLTACDSGSGSHSAGSSASSSSSSSSGKQKSGGACAVDQLGAEVGPVNAAPAAGDSGNVTVTLTNRGSACTLEGFPGVDLHAGDTSAAVPADEAAQAQKLTLAANGTTSFTITYVRGEAGGSKSLAVKTVKYSLPGADTEESFTWSYGEVALKGDGGEPDASVSAFQQSGD
ncbi:DUF4232 domain-containing protein [Streptomyces sp. HUAS ZL42]|uniref:DUF4232 domain-containing protein n=1 Tax=Streptomyces sp. HUAS ZL42 TaxID=3231715 RepID=UPI00345EF909